MIIDIALNMKETMRNMLRTVILHVNSCVHFFSLKILKSLV